MAGTNGRKPTPWDRRIAEQRRVIREEGFVDDRGHLHRPWSDEIYYKRTLGTVNIAEILQLADDVFPGVVPPRDVFPI
ncbi:MAG: hypothetical protein IMZ50_05950 [Candidatus Atribacteria bacterium]|nr:hypothetical protein [Candidatus Atribacteria bacterium]